MKGPICHCGSGSSLRSNDLIYNGKTYGNGKVWLCNNFPKCRGSVGCHDDGRPLGTIPDEMTKHLRQALHGIVDPIWKSGSASRGSVYRWLRRITGDVKDIHMGESNFEECMKLLELVRKYPFHPKKCGQCDNMVTHEQGAFCKPEKEKHGWEPVTADQAPSPNCPRGYNRS